MTPVCGHVPITMGMNVVMSGGRTTREQPGMINGVLADAWTTCPLLKYPTCFETREYTIISDSPYRTPLSEPGDSGTLIVESLPSAPRGQLRRVVGLLFGGGKRPSGHNTRVRDMDGMEVSFITPATQLISWWREDLGMEMEFGLPDWELRVQDPE
jgi:hypothetical protein